MGEGIAARFACLAGFEEGQQPYPHQIEALERLERGERLLIHAPTGSGKSEAAFVPFLALRERQGFPSRMIYVLPMRSLVDSLADRFRGLAQCNGNSIRVAAQHGRRPTSVLFYADAVIATIDQVITSYACAPLTLGVRHGNIPAGAVTSSFLVFDEVHILNPERGLQSTLLIASRLAAIAIPFIVMTATLPTTARRILCQRLGLTEISVDESHIPSRARRNVRLELALDRPLNAEAIKQAAVEGSRRVLVVCNTVDRALALYHDLRAQVSVDLVLHSRFRDEDRQAHDAKVRELLGRNGRPSLVIATQVVEVGLDISCDLLLTELCPIDALLQRAGRCARWGEAEGEVRVYALSSANGEAASAPYDPDLLEATAAALAQVDGQRLSWGLEQRLVDEVLSERYQTWLKLSRAAQAIHNLANAAFTGDRRAAEAAVRESDSVEVSLHTQPMAMRGLLRFLPTISVPIGLLRRFARQNPGSTWSLEVDASPPREDESRGIETVTAVHASRAVRLGCRYILSDGVSYSPDSGLTLEGCGEDWAPVLPQPREGRTGKGPRLEKLEQHILRGLEQFRKVIRRREGYGLERIATYVGLPPEEMKRLLLLTLICHDLGKANEAWQRAAWETLDRWLAEDPSNEATLTAEERQIVQADRQSTLLARFPSLADHSREPRRPAHATVSAYVMWEFLKRNWRNWGQAAALAMAHHHSVRASQVPAYRLTSGCLALLRALLKTEANVELTASDAELILEQPSATVLPMRMPPFHQEKPYAFYLVLSRCLSLSDRMAAGGGEDAILDYEKWAGNL